MLDTCIFFAPRLALLCFSSCVATCKHCDIVNIADFTPCVCRTIITPQQSQHHSPMYYLGRVSFLSWKEKHTCWRSGSSASISWSRDKLILRLCWRFIIWRYLWHRIIWTNYLSRDSLIFPSRSHRCPLASKVVYHLVDYMIPIVFRCFKTLFKCINKLDNYIVLIQIIFLGDIILFFNKINLSIFYFTI